MLNKEVESIFISDLHLGGGLTRLDELFCFLSEYRFNRLFLVGDIFDSLDSEDSVFFFHYLWRLQSEKQVIFLNGNHDCEKLGLDEYIYTTKSGNKVMVIHGDKFDHLITNWKWKWLGKTCYSVVMWFYGISCRLGHPARRACKAMINTANRKFNHVNRIYDGVVEYADKKDCDIVIAGHSHLAEAIEGQAKPDYLNCGDWIESATAIIEHLDGSLELIDCDERTDL